MVVYTTNEHRYKISAPKKYRFVLMVILISSLIYGCGVKKIEKVEKSEEIIPVRVARVELKEISETLDYVGNIKAEDEVLVYPKVSGKIIEKVKADGSPVNKGEVIAYIDRDEVGLKFEKAPVESPLTGIVGRVYVDIGSHVVPQTPIALVVNMTQVKITLDIPEKYLPKISLGKIAKITVDAYPRKEFNGQITRISPVLDLATRTAPVEITLDNAEHELLSGMFARVRLIIEERKNVPVVLKEAVMGKEPYLYVYVIEDSKAVLNKVSLGIRQGPYYEVKEGLKEGALVVIMGQQRLYDGALVAVEEEETSNQ